MQRMKLNRLLCIILLLVISAYCVNTENAISADSGVVINCQPIIYDNKPESSDTIIEIMRVYFRGNNPKLCSEVDVFKRFKEIYCKEKAEFGVKYFEKKNVLDTGCYEVAVDLYRYKKFNEQIVTKKATISPKYDTDDNVAIGYQIGGNTLLGISYEKRLFDAFGLHIGGGFLGFGLGARFHFNKEPLGPYLDINFKDAGFGLMESINLEFGGTLDIMDGSGPHASIGFQHLTSINDKFQTQLFGNNEVPNVLFAFQIGWAWAL